MATAAFVQKHQPGGSAYVVGDTGLYQALTDVGYTLSDYNPNYVILGETKSYPYDKIIQATRLIWAGTGHGSKGRKGMRGPPDGPSSSLRLGPTHGEARHDEVGAFVDRDTVALGYNNRLAADFTGGKAPTSYDWSVRPGT